MSRTIRRAACHENLECLLSRRRGELLHAVAREAPAFELYRHSLPARRLVPFGLARRVRSFLNDDKTIERSDLTRALRSAGAGGFVPSYRSSPHLERWGAEAGLELLTPSYRLQRFLEDKLRFHRLLEQHGLPAPAGRELTAPEQIRALPPFPLVCQTPDGEGMEGTFLVDSRRELRARLERGALKLPLLCRRFVRGTALGITIVVGARELILSAVRHQCRRLHRRQRDLAGVQWAAELPHALRTAIARVMAALGRVLRQTGFRGAANVDFVVDSGGGAGQVLIIECNPRWSSSTPLLALEPELLHGLDLVTEYIRAVRGFPLSAHRPRLPRSRFEGAYVDLGEWALSVTRAAGRRVVDSMPRLGVYGFEGDRLRFLSPDVGDLHAGDRLLLHYSTPPRTRLGARSDLGSLLTRFPLFSFREGRAALTRRGHALLEQLVREVRFRRPPRTLADLAAASPLGAMISASARPPRAPAG